MSKRKKKKGSSTSRSRIPGASQFARFSAVVSLPQKVGSGGPSAGSSDSSGSSVAVSVEDPASQLAGIVSVVDPLAVDVAAPDLNSPLAKQVDLSSSENSQSASVGTVQTAVEAVVSGQDSQIEEVKSPGQTSSLTATEKVLPALDKKWSSLLEDPSQLKEIGTPSQHISGVPFVLIPDENIEAAKDEFKDFIFAQFHGNFPEMGRVIGVVNALWARNGPRIFVHRTGPGAYLLRVSNPRTRALLLGRHVWNIAGFPMFVAPWSPEFEPDSPPITSATVTAEFRGVPYLFFSKQSLSRIATAVGSPIALAPETERKETFEVAKVLVRVDLTKDLPSKLILGLSSGREYDITVSYPWLPAKCMECNAYGHDRSHCKLWLPVPNMNRKRSNRSRSRPRNNRRSRQGRSPIKEWKVKEGSKVVVDNEVSEAVENVDGAERSGFQVAQDVNISVEGNEPVELVECAVGSEGLTAGSAQVGDAAVGLNISSTSEAETSYVASEGIESASGSVASVVEGKSVALGAETSFAKGKSVVAVVGREESVSKGSASSASQNQLPSESEAPFILVSRRKSGRKDLTKEWINIHKPLFGAFLETHIQPANAGRIIRAIPAGWKVFGNFDHHTSSRIFLVWDPSVSLVIYKSSEQLVTCGIFIQSQNLSLTVSFVYAHNLPEERLPLWEDLFWLNSNTPVARFPWAVVGDFYQILRLSHHSEHLSQPVDTTRMDAFNLALQDAELFEAQAKGLPFTWWNNQEENPFSKKIDHAFINQAWSTSFPDSYADFLDPLQSDHAPCLFQLPSAQRAVRKPFKIFQHVVDHHEYHASVMQAWNAQSIQGTCQFKLVRSLSKLKPVLRSLNKRHFSGISERVKDQAAKVSVLQREILSNPGAAAVREEHIAREQWHFLLSAEEKIFWQKSRVNWMHLGDSNTSFFYKSVIQRAARNHIHFLKDSNERKIVETSEIRSMLLTTFRVSLVAPVCHALLFLFLSCRDCSLSDAMRYKVKGCRKLSLQKKHSLSGIAEVMRHFKSLSGLDVNPAKSEIFFGGYSDIQVAVLSDLQGIKVGSFPTRYLGLPLNPARISFATLQPFLEKITNKLHAWTVRFLSFAGKIRLISSVIYGMVNFWSAVFNLPKRFYAKVDSLCASFLWKNKVTSAVGARVAWIDVCKPKEEGGLGIRLLEEFAIVFQLKLIWNLFTSAGSLWVAWIKGNILRRKSFWSLQNSPSLSRTVNSMIRLKPYVKDFMRCELRNGETASFWYDHWNELGPLIDLIGATGPRVLRIRKEAMVVEAVQNGAWRMPGARSDSQQQLLIMLTTITPPSIDNGSDVYLWRRLSGSFASFFSSKETWEQLRSRSTLVPWNKAALDRAIRDRLLTVPGSSSSLVSPLAFYFGCVNYPF
ncbi:unnamed protein product [Arabidopsis arenosa]|uniref:DUF4283 domain-containing protein n=1 Tax=Arabidopsis arenosa TaxID=38785 RepID=A0A8S2A2M0_ARAAE|nr:unnamed protein product [Arabidopsis arenosa]